MPTAAQMAGLTTGEGTDTSIIISLLTLFITIFASVALRGFFSIIPILIGVVSGYITPSFGLVDWSIVAAAPGLLYPLFIHLFSIRRLHHHHTARSSGYVIAEHIGHLIVTNNIIGKDLTAEPGPGSFYIW